MIIFMPINFKDNSMAFEEDVALVGGTDESYDNLDMFQEAWNHPDE